MTSQILRYRLTMGCESGGVRLPVLQTAGIWIDAASALTAACEIVGKPLTEAHRAIQNRGIVTIPCSPLGWSVVKNLPVVGVSIDRLILAPDASPIEVDCTFPGLNLNALRTAPSRPISSRRKTVTRIW